LPAADRRGERQESAHASKTPVSASSIRASGMRPPETAAQALPGIADLLIVGGGINGAGIARDAAGRGLSVVLCEKGDLAQGTSSRSSRLIHGGLRYLEYGEFRLVREALRERETLMTVAPHLVRPLRFVLPHVPRMRPAWMLRAGLFLYDHLARRQRLAGSRAVRFARVPEGGAVQAHIRRGFIYSDCRTDDARLVLANARGARELGARLHLHTEFLAAARRADGLWRARLTQADGTALDLTARALVNAAGPWVESVHPRVAGVRPRRRALLVKGSHIVVKRFWSGEHAFILQNDDRRVVFATPYEEGFAMIGTTDLRYSQAPEEAAITEAEIDYLCAAANRQLRCSLGRADVRFTFAGVRSLAEDEHDNPSAVTRDYHLDIDEGRDDAGPVREAAAGSGVRPAPYVTVLGGKITTYRRLSEHLLDALAPWFPQARGAWTATRPLPGGDLGEKDADTAYVHFARANNFLPPSQALGYFNRHGSHAREVLGGAYTIGGLGRHFGGGLYECEVDYLIENEWAQSAQDILWRRTKFGLYLSAKELAEFEQWLQRRAG
jgi:glycerol-3-phosphate dehydrogenase